jgi:hypothetical protein
MSLLRAGEIRAKSPDLGLGRSNQLDQGTAVTFGCCQGKAGLGVHDG